MERFARFAATAAVPLGLLNLLATIVAGVWLGMLGRWSLIGYGLVALIVAGLVAAGFARKPGLLLDVPAAALREMGHNRRACFLSFLGSLYRVAVLTVWCLAVLFFFARRADTGSVIPTLLWSYGIAAGPIAWMDQNEIQGGGGKHSAVVTLFAQVGYILVLPAILFYGVSLEDAAMLFGAVMVTGLVVLARVASRKEAIDDLL